MSANNWRVCPKCLKNDKKQKKSDTEQLKKAYGKVSEEEYLSMKARIEAQQEIIPENLREDWSIGIDEDGNFFVSYRCSCDVCGFDFDYSIEKKVKL